MTEGKNYDSIHFNHEVTVYIPCYQTNQNGYPSFNYSMADAQTDEEMAWSMKPDYVLVLKGKFDAKTQPYSREVENYNRHMNCCANGNFEDGHFCQKQDGKP